MNQPGSTAPKSLDAWQTELTAIAEHIKKITALIVNNHANSPLHGFKFVIALGWSYKKLLKKYVCSVRESAQGRHAIQAFHKDIKHWIVFAKALLQGKSPQTLFPFPEQDKRFRHAHWKNKPPYVIILQMYLLLNTHLRALANATPWDGRDKQQIHFCTDLLLETLCPNNCLLTNPEAMRYTRQEKGLNLLKGTKYFLEDIQRWQGHINLSKTNFNAFHLGKNLAATPGKVIFRNHLIELIFYQPTTKKQYEKPLLLVTSWINKFYILDLQTQNSLIAWLVDQGFCVFTIAWINPNADHRGIGLDHFVRDGVICALNIIKKTLSCEQVHAMGYCLGGTLLAIAAAYLQSHRDASLATLTFIATLVDFSEGGGIGNLMGPEQLAVYKKTLASKHVWDGHKMQIGFNLTNSNHFIWPFVQRRYLMGKSSIAIDSIHWGLDLANTTEAMYQFYTNDLHRDNLLMSPNTLKVLDTAIDIAQCSTPMCGIGFEEDSISPWKSAFPFFHRHGCQFILAPGNHITGLISPPQNKRATHISADVLSNEPEQWKKQQTSVPGSWWIAWKDWLQQHNDQQTSSALSVYEKIDAICEAPGSFILD